MSDSDRALTQEIERFGLQEADAFGVAPADAFGEAPPGARPTDLMPVCRSVVVFALKHLDAFACSANLACQAYSQDIMNGEILHQAYRIARFLEKRGFLAFPIVASVSMWPFAKEDAGVAGRISLRHAAQRAGIGRIGRNAMLISPQFGPRMQLGAILTNAQLVASEPLAEDPCFDCDLCVRRCPSGALEAPVAPARYTPVQQQKCLGYRREFGGKSPLGYPNACGLCRAVCPVGRIRDGGKARG